MFFKKLRTMPPGFSLFENANGTFYWQDNASGFKSFSRGSKAETRSAAWYSYDRLEEERILYPKLIEEGK